MKELKVGDPVLLTLDVPGTVGITAGLRKYQDRRFAISRIKQVVVGAGMLRGTYYELRGCVSDEGVPYGVTGDWIMPILEADNGCVHGRRKT